MQFYAYGSQPLLVLQIPMPAQTSRYDLTMTPMDASKDAVTIPNFIAVAPQGMLLTRICCVSVVYVHVLVGREVDDLAVLEELREELNTRQAALQQQEAQLNERVVCVVL